jgi:hypothetical protein
MYTYLCPVDFPSNFTIAGKSKWASTWNWWTVVRGHENGRFLFVVLACAPSYNFIWSLWIDLVRTTN